DEADRECSHSGNGEQAGAAAVGGGALDEAPDALFENVAVEDAEGVTRARDGAHRGGDLHDGLRVGSGIEESGGDELVAGELASAVELAAQPEGGGLEGDGERQEFVDDVPGEVVARDVRHLVAD